MTESMADVFDQLPNRVIAAMNEHVLPGVAVGIVRGGELVYANGFGLADVEGQTPVTPTTVFRIGSISKTMTALGLMRLWEQGKFGLDDPVNDYLTSYRVETSRPGGPPITFKHLLTHTAGIGMVRGLTDLALPNGGLGAADNAAVPPLADYYQGGLKAEVEAGAKWSYANHAFATLGQVIEDISGQPLPDYMRRHVFEPLGMLHTDYVLSDRVRDQLAQGYQFTAGKLTPVPYQEIIVRGAGSVFSSVEDMARYVSALLNGGRNAHGRVLEPATLALLLRPHYQLDRRLPAMGLGFVLEDMAGHRLAWHNGGWPGFSSLLLAAPDDGLGLVLFTNTLNFAFDGVGRGLLRALLGITDTDWQLPRPGLLETPWLWSDLRGFYGPAQGFGTNLSAWLGYGGELEVHVARNHLALRAPIGPFRKGAPLYRADATDPLVFEMQREGERQTVVFRRGAAGQVDSLALGFNVLYKRSLLRSLRLKALAAVGGLVALGAGLMGWRKARSQRRGGLAGQRPGCRP